MPEHIWLDIPCPHTI